MTRTDALSLAILDGQVAQARLQKAVDPDDAARLFGGFLVHRAGQLPSGAAARGAVLRGVQYPPVMPTLSTRLGAMARSAVEALSGLARSVREVVQPEDVTAFCLWLTGTPESPGFFALFMRDLPDVDRDAVVVEVDGLCEALTEAAVLHGRRMFDRVKSDLSMADLAFIRHVLESAALAEAAGDGDCAYHQVVHARLLARRLAARRIRNLRTEASLTKASPVMISPRSSQAVANPGRPGRPGVKASSSAPRKGGGGLFGF